MLTSFSPFNPYLHPNYSVISICNFSLLSCCLCVDCTLYYQHLKWKNSFFLDFLAQSDHHRTGKSKLMAAWSSFTNGNGSPVDCLDTPCAYQGNGCFLNFDHLVKDHVGDTKDDKAKQKCLFYQLLSVHLKENSSRGIIRPLPVMLGDGQSLDLYKLFFCVKEKGGYTLVSKKGLWGSVAKELDLNIEIPASVRLIYEKYLNEFEGWLRKTIGEKKFNNGYHGSHWGFSSSPIELEKEFRALLNPIPNWKGDRPLESDQIRKYIDVANQKSETNLLDSQSQLTILEDVQRIYGDDDEKFRNDLDNHVAILDVEVAQKECNSRKRKREELSGMLNWIRHIAKHPVEPSIKPIPEMSKWKEYKGNDLWVQILKARDVLLLRQCVEQNGESSSLQKLKMHPALYEDQVTFGSKSTMKLRCSERHPASGKSRLCSCCNSHVATGNKATTAGNTEVENGPLEQTTVAVDLFTAKGSKPSGDDAIEKQVSVGPFFQAEVPEWTGVVCESDSKWLGTQVWPSKYIQQNPDTETEFIGKGREEKCGCEFQGSVACVRFHIAEKRMKLKLELGSAFYLWRFDRMGEEVSLQWTAEDEKKFKDVMRSSLPSQIRYFWNHSFKYFPNKTRNNLVSYYFNVYLIQRRIYQNRVTPNSVDSDDEELEFGSLSDGFGMETVKGPGINFLECCQNKQCTDPE